MNAPRIVKTMCPMNCHPTLCGMEVKVSGGEVEIAGDPSHPDSHGFLCMRGEAAHQIVGNPDRLLRPLVRDSRKDDFREATWDEALGRIAGKMAEVGRESVALWAGHGMAVNDYGVGVKGSLIQRFGNLYGCQRWGPQMICWGLGGFGFGLTGAIDTSTAPDMADNAAMVILWGANTASQANTTRHIVAAKQRGAPVVAIDVRRTEASALADEVLLVRPGSDAALALGMMHVIVAEDLCDHDFIARHTTGFADLAAHLESYTPDWAEAETGVPADRIAALARRYGATRPATIVAGGSSLHKGRNGWRAARAIACLPALVGDYGVPGGGMGVRHGVHSSGRVMKDIMAADRRPPGAYIPNQMAAIANALDEGRIRALVTLGANIGASFPDAARLADGLDRTELFVAYDIFMNDTARRHADIVLPSTIWLEELGCKATGGWLHLSDTALPPAGEARPIYEILPDLAARLGVEDVYPWDDHEQAIEAVIGDACAGGASVAKLRAAGGRLPLKVSPHAYPERRFHTPSGRIEFRSARAEAAGLPPLPVSAEASAGGGLRFAHGRTWTHFHSFYDHGRALPALAARNAGPELWLSPEDAAARDIANGAPIRIESAQGAFEATALVTKRMPEGAVWMRDGWPGLNALTSGAPVLPEAALDFFPFTVGQSDYGAEVEVRAL